MELDHAELRTSLSAGLGEPCELVAGWSAAPESGGIVRAIYALPSLRFATLRHWRDELEFMTPGGLHVVALEASKWARLLLKAHGGTLLASARTADLDPHGGAARLGSLAPTLWTEDSDAWATAAGRQPLLPSPPTAPADRFAMVEAWLREVRQVVDALAADWTNPSDDLPSRDA